MSLIYNIINSPGCGGCEYLLLIDYLLQTLPLIDDADNDAESHWN